MGIVFPLTLSNISIIYIIKCFGFIFSERYTLSPFRENTKSHKIIPAINISLDYSK